MPDAATKPSFTASVRPAGVAHRSVQPIRKYQTFSSPVTTSRAKAGHATRWNCRPTAAGIPGVARTTGRTARTVTCPPIHTQALSTCTHRTSACPVIVSMSVRMNVGRSWRRRAHGPRFVVQVCHAKGWLDEWLDRRRAGRDSQLFQSSFDESEVSGADHGLMLDCHIAEGAAVEADVGPARGRGHLRFKSELIEEETRGGSDLTESLSASISLYSAASVSRSTENGLG